jgi:hypothetical protein
MGVESSPMGMWHIMRCGISKTDAW